MGKKHFVLIAEDDEADKYLIEEFFQEKCPLLSYYSVDNGQELLQFLNNNPVLPDVILSDINMPRVNGLEALKAIKTSKDKRFKNIPFIILSTSIAMQDKSAAALLGADKFIQKPDDFKKFYLISDAIFEVLSKK